MQITLRDFQPQDRETLAHWMHPDHKWQQMNGPYYRKPPAEVVPKIVDRWLTTEPSPIRERMVIAQADNDAVLGTVSRYWISEETHWLALGITLYDPATWGKGLGYQALGLWCQYHLDADADLIRLDLQTWSGNVGMMRLAEKLGFLREATFRKARIVDGIYYDGLGYGILREEWEQRYPQGFAAAD